MSHKTVIHRVRPSDADLLRSTRLRALGDAPMAFGTTLAEATARPTGFWTAQASGQLGDRGCATWVAIDANRNGVGMIAGVEENKSVDVLQVWIAPTLRGTGLVECLFDVLFEWAPRRTVKIAVAQTNGRALAAYLRLGFAVSGTRPGRHETEIEMEQTLPGSRPQGGPDRPAESRDEGEPPR